MRSIKRKLARTEEDLHVEKDLKKLKKLEKKSETPRTSKKKKKDDKLQQKHKASISSPRHTIQGPSRQKSSTQQKYQSIVVPVQNVDSDNDVVDNVLQSSQVQPVSLVSHALSVDTNVLVHTAHFQEVPISSSSNLAEPQDVTVQNAQVQEVPVQAVQCHIEGVQAGQTTPERKALETIREHNISPRRVPKIVKELTNHVHSLRINEIMFVS